MGFVRTAFDPISNYAQRFLRMAKSLGISCSVTSVPSLIHYRSRSFAGDAKTRTVWTTRSTPLAVQPMAFFLVTVGPDVLLAGGLLAWIILEASC
jgi:hypothetical protein